MSWNRKDRQAIYKKVSGRDGWSCHYCGRPLAKPGTPIPNLGIDMIDGKSVQRGIVHGTLDHMNPRNDRGNSNPKNIVLACWLCNTWKGSLSHDAFMAIMHVWVTQNRNALLEAWHATEPKQERTMIMADKYFDEEWYNRVGIEGFALGEGCDLRVDIDGIGEVEAAADGGYMHFGGTMPFTDMLMRLGVSRATAERATQEVIATIQARKDAAT